MDNMKPLNPIQKTVVGVQFLFCGVWCDCSRSSAGWPRSFYRPFYCWYRHVDLSFGDERESSYFSGKQFRFCGAYHKGDGIVWVARYDVRPGGCGDRLWVDELVGPVERNRFYQAAFSAGGDRAGYYSDRPLAGRLRCEYGKENWPLALVALLSAILASMLGREC